MMNILYGCDDNYAPYTGISLTSLLENNKEEDQITIYLAAMDFSDDNKVRFGKLVETYNRKLVFIEVSQAKSMMDVYQCKGWNGSIATWLRFFVLDQIQDKSGKLLWLDSDTIVLKNLHELFEIDINSMPMACVCDPICYKERFRLGFGYDDPYFNAGVILFDLKIWNENNILEDMMMHLRKNIERYSLNDQDLLNDYFKGRIYKLPQKYNVQGFHLAYKVNNYFSIYPWSVKGYYGQESVQKSIEDPSVIHFLRFLGDYPWQEGKNYHPACRLYEEWKKISLWSDCEPVSARTEKIFKIEKLLYCILPEKSFLRIFEWITNRKLPQKP